MNKKEAIAYAQITLNYMKGAKYNGPITAKTFGIEMRQAFKLYPKNLVLTIADAQLQAEQKLEDIENESNIN